MTGRDCPDGAKYSRTDATMQKMTCYGECAGLETSYEYIGEDDDGYEVWQCTVCGNRAV